jgi:hypothetical protein
MKIQGLTLTASEVVQLIGLIIPFLVAFIAHQNAPSWLKGGLHAVLAAITGSVGVLVATTGGYDWQAFVSAILAALGTSVMSYIVVAKHIGGPQLEATGLSLGKSLATAVSTATVRHFGRHEAGHVIPAIPATKNGEQP